MPGQILTFNVTLQLIFGNYYTFYGLFMAWRPATLFLIDRAPGNDVTSLSTYTTHSRASVNPVESNGPTGHKNAMIQIFVE